VSFQWRWYYPAPSVGLWALIVSLLVVVKRTRSARAWLILIALVPAIILWQMEGLSPLFLSLGAAAIIVWLVGGAHPTYRTRHRGESIDSQAPS